MSLKSDLQNIYNAKNDIKVAIESKLSDTIDQNFLNYANYVNNISGGGGADLSNYFNYSARNSALLVDKYPYNLISNRTNLSGFLTSIEGGKIYSNYNFDVSNVTNISGFVDIGYDTAPTLREINIRNFGAFSDNLQIANGYNKAWFDGGYYNTPNLINIVLDNFDIANCTNVGVMFRNFTNVNNIRIGHYFNNVVNLGGILENMPKINNLGFISYGCNQNNVEFIDFIASNCPNLNNIYGISGWRPVNLSNVNTLFYNCPNLQNLTPLNYWNVKVTDNFKTLISGNSNVNANLTPFYSWDYNNLTVLRPLVSASINFENRIKLYENILNKGNNISAFDSLFANESNLTNTNALSNWNLSKITSITSLFSGSLNLSDINGISNWDLSNVTNIIGLFANTNISDLSALENWNTSKIEYMSGTFSGTNVSNLAPIANWNTSNLKDFRMFTYCKNITNFSSLNWDLSNVEDLSIYGMSNLATLDGFEKFNMNKFNGLPSISSGNKLVNIDAISNWDIANINWPENIPPQSWEDLNGIGVNNLNALRNWDMSNFRYYMGIFRDCPNLTDISGLSSWNMSNCVQMQYMFGNCMNLTNFEPINTWRFNGEKLVSIPDWFSHTKIQNLHFVQNWNIKNISSFRSAFKDCPLLQNINDMPNVNYISNSSTWPNADLGGLFQNCYNLTDVSGLSHINFTIPINNVINMFYGCNNLTSLNGVQNLPVIMTSLGGFITNCSKLSDISAIGNWDISLNINNMRDLSGWFAGTNISNVAVIENWNYTFTEDMYISGYDLEGASTTFDSSKDYGDASLNAIINVFSNWNVSGIMVGMPYPEEHHLTFGTIHAMVANMESYPETTYDEVNFGLGLSSYQIGRMQSLNPEAYQRAVENGWEFEDYSVELD